MSEERDSGRKSALEKLEKQNDKLRSELKDLTTALESARKRQRHAKVPPVSELYEDKESLTVNTKISRLKQEISKMKKELEGNLNMSKVTDLENHSKFLSKHIEELESEQKSLKKIEKEQQKALISAQNSNTYPEKITKLKEDIRTCKEKYRELVAKQKQDEKLHKAQHEKCVDLEEKCRKLFEQIKKKKLEEEENKKKNNDTNERDVTEDDVKRLEEKIKQAEQTKNEEEMRIKKKLKEYEAQAREGKHNLDMLKIKVKEKDQECRLNALKIKELKKAMKQSQSKSVYRNFENNPSNQKLDLAYNEQERNIDENIENLQKSDEDFNGYLDNRIINDISGGNEIKKNTDEFIVNDIEKQKQNLEKKHERFDTLFNNLNTHDKNVIKEVNVQEEIKIEPPAPKKIDFSKPNFNF